MSIIKAINGFPQNKNPSYIILDIIEEINNLRVDGKVIEILWIPSHTDITGNEDVDRLACLTDGIPYSLELMKFDQSSRREFIGIGRICGRHQVW